MKRIIIFRFSEHLPECVNRIEHLIWLNPGLPLYGIYGGSDKDVLMYKSVTEKYFEDLYIVSDRSKHWKWKNFDIILQDWYIKTGRDIDFDMAHIIEWDLLLLEGIKELYRYIPNGYLGLTGIVPIKEIEDKWYWTSDIIRRQEWLNLMAILKERYAYNCMPYATFGPGTCLPKAFLEKYSELDIPELCNDEIRIPLFAQILDFPF